MFTNNFSFLIEIIFLLTALYSVVLSKNFFAAKKHLAISNFFILVICLVILGNDVYFNYLYNQQNEKIIPWADLLIIAVVSNSFMAVVYSSVKASSKNSLALIQIISFLSILILNYSNFYIFIGCLCLILLLIYHLDFRKYEYRSIFKYYLILFSLLVVLLSFNFLGSANNQILSFILLIFIIGVTPFQSWFLKFFEKVNLAVASLLICFICCFIWKYKNILLQLNLNDNYVLTLAILGVFSSVFSILQKNPRRSIAYIVSSQLAFLVFSHANSSEVVNFGSGYLVLAIIIALNGFILLLNALEVRSAELSLVRPSGAYESYPKLSFMILIFGLASTSFPLTIGYIAEDLIFEGSFHAHYLDDIFWIISIAFNSIAIMKMFFYLCQGVQAREQNLDLKYNENITAWIVIILLLLIPIFSKLIF
jgi:formate hydrogenlyase subunit 3/multisubunit Na+/H+ antiporter MnhD subunit